MPITTQVKLHDERVIWPAQRSYEQVLMLRAQTIPSVWSTTYQSDPVAAGGTIFQREWWDGQNRYDINDRKYVNLCVARWHSWDTALKDKEDNAYTALTVGELLPDYRLIIREVWRDRFGFPGLPAAIERFARRDAYDGKLRAVIIEDKASGTSAIQTLQQGAESWLRELITPFMPSGDKVQRANQAAVWCSNGCVLLPQPSEGAKWLHDFETEAFAFPGSSFADQVDSFSQLILFTENLLSEGFRARQGVLANG